MKSILITGTKGKTTIAMMLSKILRMSGEKVLCINSEGVFSDGKLLNSKEYYLKKYFTSPTVKAFSEINKKQISKYDYLVAEASYASLGNIKKSFLGNKFNAGIFTNLYWDHIDDLSISSRRKLFFRKIDIMKNVEKGGTIFIFVGNRRNNLSYKAVDVLKKERPDCRLIAYSDKKISKYPAVEKCFFYNNNVFLNNKKIFELTDKSPELTRKAEVLQQALVPIVVLLKIFGIDNKIINDIGDPKEAIPGRLNIFESHGCCVVLDSAHEIMSLKYAHRLLRRIYPKKKIIAICRFSYQRTDEYIKKIVSGLACLYDEFIIYDKAMSRGKAGLHFANNKQRKNSPGYLARMIKNIMENKKRTKIVYNEFEAIAEGIKKLKKGEILYIMGDQINKDLAVIKRELKNKEIAKEGTNVFEKGKLDEQWIGKIKNLGNFEIYELFYGDDKHRLKQRKLFLAGKIKNPKLDYPKLKKRWVLSRRMNLVKLADAIRKKEKNIFIKRAYLWKIKEKITELDLALAAINNDPKGIKKYSESVYGKPERGIFNFSINQLKKFAKKRAHWPNKEIRKAAADLLAALPDKTEIKASVNDPKKRELDFFEKYTRSEFNADLHLIKRKNTYNSKDIRESFNKILRARNIAEWQARITKNIGTAISVDHQQETISIPKGKALSYPGLCNLVIHEIGTHIYREINGRKSKLGLLEIGFDRYVLGEEGIATSRERSISRKLAGFSGLEGYLAVGLVYGLDGQKRDFRSLYEILEKIYLLLALSSGEKPTRAASMAKLKSWERCVRTFRGTDCQTLGICLTKDIIYRQGNINIWQTIRNNPEEIYRFSVGKYDPSNRRHVKILDQLGIK